MTRSTDMQIQQRFIRAGCPGVCARARCAEGKSPGWPALPVCCSKAGAPMVHTRLNQLSWQSPVRRPGSSILPGQCVGSFSEDCLGQRQRPPPVAETGSCCWGRGLQDASAAQGVKQMQGAATRIPYFHVRRGITDALARQIVIFSSNLLKILDYFLLHSCGSACNPFSVGL